MKYLCISFPNKVAGLRAIDYNFTENDVLLQKCIEVAFNSLCNLYCVKDKVYI